LSSVFSLSAGGTSQFGSLLFDSMSESGQAILASSLSVRSFAQFGVSVSSSASVAVSNSVSAFESACLYGGLSVRESSNIGCPFNVFSFGVMREISVRGTGNINGLFSVVDAGQGYFGRSLSIRSYARFGSNLCVEDFPNIGYLSSLSVIGTSVLGSTLSVRSYSAFGVSLSISSQVLVTTGLDILASRLGSSLSGVLALDALTFEALTSLW
jgi:hypothetical protein